MRYREREARLLLVLLTIANPVVVALELGLSEFVVEGFSLSSIRWRGTARKSPPPKRNGNGEKGEEGTWC